MKYQILINYDTGDSFTHHPGVEDTIELEWESLENAKAALKTIQEHYQYYKVVHPGWSLLSKKEKDERELKLKEAESKPWFVKEYPDHCLKLVADNGNEMQMSAFWCGYFETLNFAEIVPAKSELDKSTDTKIYF